MADITNCKIRNIYKNFLMIYDDDFQSNKITIGKGSGHYYDSVFKIVGSISSSVIDAQSVALRNPTNSCDTIVIACGSQNYRPFDSASRIQLSERTVVPTTSIPNNIGGLSFINNVLYVYGEVD